MATITTFDLNGSASGVDVARSYTENGAAITLAPSATLAATGNFAGQTLRLSGLLPEARIGFGSGVTISGTSVQVGGVAIGSLTGGTGGADLVFTFNTSATASRVQTLLRNLTYSDTSDQPTATQPILFDLAGTVRTDIVSVVAVNDLPVIDLNGAASGFNGSASLLENGSVAIAPAATLSDVDTSNLVSLTASLLARPDGNGVEALALNAAAAAAASAAGLSVAYAASTGILTISGAASQATYQAVLSGITYANTSENPATAARTVRVVTNDGQGTSVARDASVGIVRVNDAPVLDLNGAAAGTSADLLYSIGGAAAPITPTATVEDIDSANFSGGSLRAAFTQNGTSTDQLRIVTDGVVTLSGTTVRVNGTSVGTVSGGVDGADLVVSLNTGASPAAVQALVQHIGYLSGPGNTSLLARQVTFTANDGDGIANGGQAVGSAVATVNLTSVANAPPVMTGDLQAPIANGGTYVFTTSDFYFTDPDDVATGVTFRASQLDNGYILINRQAVSSFTAAQLAAGQVSFWHDGTEPVGSFRLTVDDGNEDNSTPTARTFVFNVGGAPANVAPVLTGDFQATVANAGSYVLTGADLSFTDPDDTAATVTFSVGSVTNGSLRIGGAAVTSFTGQQLASGQVSFLHNGAAPSASFSVSVEDGNEDNSTPVARSFVFDVGGGTGTGLLDLSGAGRGVSANLGAGSWHLADRVMALGDSITNGDSPPGADEHGYRGFLWNNLIRNDILIDLVGPNSNGAVPDPQHAGYPGETGDDIQALLPSLLATYTPSAILLMAGTNDVFYKSNPQVAVQAEIRGMLDHVAQNSPSTHVYVSTLLPLAGYATQVPAVNAAIRTAVNESIALGRDVSLVEMPDIGLSDLFDGIHPTDAGYLKMAAHWTAAFLADQPDRSPPTAIAASVDSITGSVHNDLLTGDGRANALSGGSGQDRLRGEGGADMLTGGAQADTFVFGPGFGQDTITDFRPNEDQLDLRALSLTVGNFNTWLQANASTVGTATVLTIGAGDTIRLNDVTLASLHANDFLF